MATRVDLPKEIITSAFETKCASLRRGINSATNPVIKEALQQELGAITSALGKMVDIKG